MARYDREWSTRGRRPRRSAGPRGREAGEPEYGRDYGEQPAFRERYAYRRGPDYGATMDYGAERGYGAWTEYGERRPGGGYEGDFDFGGRGWPYREGARAGRRTPMRPYRGYGAEYGREMRRPEAFEPLYGYDYTRFGPPGRRHGARGRGPGRRAGRMGPSYGRMGPYGRTGAYGRMTELERWGYGGEYGGRTYAERYAERDMRTSAGGRAAEWHYGHTPPDRWPAEGHDVDRRPSRELRMNDGEIRNVVLENIFQDSWVDPERIDIEVSDGIVTLTGEVRDFMEARYAWDDAWESAGVRGVIDNLTVRTDLPQEHMEMPQTTGSSKGRQGRGSR